MAKPPEAKLKPINLGPIERATDRPWTQWLEFMESIGARDLNHTQIAQKVLAELETFDPPLDNPAWWSQGITVAYEQHSGRRLPGQQADGTFQMSVSKTTKLDLQEAMDRWVEFAASDPEVVAMTASEPRVSGTDKRKTWRAKASNVGNLMFTSELRPTGKTAVLAQQMKLPSQEENEQAKVFWAAVMERFVEAD